MSNAPCFSRQIAQGREEIRRRFDEAHVADDRLDNDTGNLIAAGVKGAFQSLRIVELQYERVSGAAFGHARTARHAMRQGTGTGRDQQAIDMAVIAAGEFYDRVAAGCSRAPGGWRSSPPRCRN